MNWIRIAVSIDTDPSILAIARDCGVRVAEAVGLVVRLLCRVPQHARDGNLGGLDDRAIETWAGWEGKRGVFAVAFRDNFLTDAGVIRAWEKHNGAAIRESDYDRQRKAEERRRVREASGGRSGNRPVDSPADVRKTSVVDGTGRDGTTIPSSSEGPFESSSAAQRAVSRARAPEAVAAIVGRISA